MHKVLVTGSNGQIGSEIKALSTQYNLYTFTFVDRSHIDLNNLSSIQKYFINKNFDFIINCAAYTAVDKAEEESEKSEAINHFAVAEFAKIALEKNISLIHLSTDYVFNGKNFRPYIESDTVDPINAYGISKRRGEEAILTLAPANSIIIRTSWVYSKFGNNFVKSMLRLGRERESLKVVFDQVGTPTYGRDLAKVILDILPKIKNMNPEIYNYSNEGVTSWYDFANAIFEISEISCLVEAITSDQYPLPAERPHYSLLNKEKIKREFGIIIPGWRQSLKECLE